MWAKAVLRAMARLYKTCRILMCRWVQRVVRLLRRILTTNRRTKLTAPKTTRKSLMQLGLASFSKAWHGFPQLVHSFSRKYVAYIYDSFRTIPQFQRLQCNTTVARRATNLLSQRFCWNESCGQNIVVVHDSRIWLNDIYAISEKNHGSLPPCLLYTSPSPRD